MSQKYVLDSYALLAFFEGEPGAEQVASLLKQARDREEALLLSLINWGEVYYITRREAGAAAADEVLRRIETLPIEIVPAEREITILAATLKATYKMSYADCFAAALTQLSKAKLVTGDREFAALAGDLSILWLE